jgi:hypothetical protein
MNIGKFAKKPQLVKIELTDTDIVEAYGEVITFWIMDHLDIATYFDFYKSQSSNDGDKLNELMRELILDEKGKPVIAKEQMLPIDLAVASLTAINEHLGKRQPKKSTPTTGEHQN